MELGVTAAPAATAPVVGDGPAAAAGADPDEGPGVAGAPLAAVAEVPGPGAVGDMSVISSSNRFRLMARELVEIWTMMINQITLTGEKILPPPFALVVLSRGTESSKLRWRREPGQGPAENVHFIK